MILLGKDREHLQDLSYKKLITFDNFGDRLNFLSLMNRGYKSPREISNAFYKSRIWREMRDYIIARDLGYDLGIKDVEIEGSPLVHHMIPLLEEDILEWREDIILNPDLLITTSYNTHNIIHYGFSRVQSMNYVERLPGDTKLW